MVLSPRDPRGSCPAVDWTSPRFTILPIFLFLLHPRAVVGLSPTTPITLATGRAWHLYATLQHCDIYIDMKARSDSSDKDPVRPTTSCREGDADQSIVRVRTP